MIRVHHLNNSRSQRILWLLEELDRPYEVVRYERDPATMMAPPALRQVHPLGKSPVLEEGATVIAESGAIVEYLAGPPGSALVPAEGSAAHLRYVHFLHFAEGSAMTPLLLKLYLDRFGMASPEAVRTRVEGQVKGVLDYLEGELGRAEWFCGEAFTAADIQISFPIELSVQRAGLDASRPKLWDYLQRIHARPAYGRALERGGPYSYA